MTTENNAAENVFEVWKHSEYDEAFLSRPNLITDLLNFLNDMKDSSKTEDRKKDVEVEQDISKDVTDKNFLVVKAFVPRQSQRHKMSREQVQIMSLSPPLIPENIERMTISRQIDVCAKDRMLARLERERTANNFRRFGNDLYRHGKYDQAIIMYTKGLQYIKDTPVLYVNRAICHIKMSAFKLALFDCEYILNHLDNRNLKAMLYRAAAYKRLKNEKKFEECIHEVRFLNTRHSAYIDYFLEKMRTDL